MARRRARSEQPGRGAVQLLLAAVAFLAFAPTLGHELVWDDPFLVDRVESLVSDGGLGELMTAEFQIQGHLGYYRPVVLLTFWIDSWLAGGSATAYHFTNLVLHALCTLLAWRFLRYWVAPATAFLASLFFAVHPVHTESVAFVSGRTDLLAAAFALLAALLWARVARGGSEGKGVHVAASGVALLLATLSKEVAFVLPAVLLAWDALSPPASASAPGIGWWRRNRTWLAAWCTALALSLGLRLAVAGVGFGVQGASVPSGAAVLTGIWTTSLRLLLVPWPLTAHYTPARYSIFWLGSTGVTVDLPGVLASLALIGFCLSVRRLGHSTTGLLALAWMGAFLVPVSGIVPLAGTVLAERFLYLPSLGACLALGVAFGELSPRRPLRVAAVVLAAAGFVVSFTHSRVWRDDATLFAATVETSPDSALAHFNLANALAEAGQVDRAISEYSKALRLDPTHVRARNNRGMLFARTGRPDKARSDLRRALEIDPDHANTHRNMGMLQGTLGHWAESAAAFRRVTELEPDDAVARFNLGSALVNAKDYAAAAPALERALELDPDNDATRELLARVYRGLRRPADAAEVLRGNGATGEPDR